MKIKTSEYVSSVASKENYPTGNLPEFLLCGRSNVGKSSFINTLLDRKNLAYTSSKPGKTQTLNFFLINEAFYFVDVPGYGYAKVSKKQREEFGVMIEEYLQVRNNLKIVFQLIDFRHKPSEDDILMYEYLKYHEIEVCLIATKVDKVGKTQIRKQEKLIKAALNFEESDSLILYSAVTKMNKDQVLNIIDMKTRK